ncbi:MAG: hypothetical protein O7E49_14040 [Gemmatimonadetes bacterium]|nr:hypothetical protein [Gemmatimonadota bacterium]
MAVNSAGATPGTETYTDGQNTMTLTQVEVVLREIELEPVEIADCDAIPEPTECHDFEVGPTLVPVPLGTAERMFSISIDPGSYDELEFDFHKISSDDPADDAFRTAHPDMVDKSIRVSGTFNGQAFVYESDLNVEQEFDLTPVMVIEESTLNTNITLRIGLSDWFRDQAGMLIDPNEGNKGGQYENMIKENIKQSIEAFEDRDGDGDDLDES